MNGSGERNPGWRRLAIAVAVVGAFASALGTPQALAQSRGGEVIVAQGSNPPSLDAMVTSSQASRNVNMNVYEALYCFDENVKPIPQLAEGLDMSDDGLTYTFSLRKGVKFHNGKEMTSADVKASLERYQRHGASPAIMKPVTSIEATGPYEVKLTLAERTPPFLEAFTSPRAPVVIIPEEEAGKGPNEIAVIGTGPYRFVEYVPDSHVELARFDEYSADTRYAGRNGFGGRKTAYFDTVTFRVIPEAGARVAALQAGEVHVVEQLPVPAARRLEGDADITIYENVPWAFLTLWLNGLEAPTDNPKLRRAIQVALNMEEVMAIATEGLYQLDHGWQYSGTTYHAGDVGKELYNVADLGQAKALVAQSGYDGQELSILTDSNYGEHNRAAVVVGETLKKIGINAKVNQVDWPTALKIRLQDDGWNAWTLMMGIEPYLGPYGLAAVFVGKRTMMRKTDPILEELYGKLVSEPDESKRVALFGQYQARIYEDQPVIKFGNVGLAQATRANVANFAPFRFPRMYDVWFAD